MMLIPRGTDPSPSESAMADDSKAVPKEALYAILILFLLIALSLAMYAMARVAKYWGVNRAMAKAHIVSIVKTVYRTLGTHSAPGLAVAGAQYPLHTILNVPHVPATAPSTGGGLTPSTAAVADTVTGTSVD